MTSEGSAADNDHDHGLAAADLSSIFGAPAAALSRRRIRTRRPRQAREPDPAEPEIMENDVPDAKSRRAPGTAGAPRAREPGRASQLPGAPAPRQRFGVVKVRDRQHVGLLLLAAAREVPGNGYELIDLVRERSDGLFVLSLRIVIHELHRLANNRLMQVTGRGRLRRYSLTPLGQRVLATRRREWEAFSDGLNKVLDAGAGPARAE